jgi:hypothetical protein
MFLFAVCVLSLGCPRSILIRGEGTRNAPCLREEQHRGIFPTSYPVTRDADFMRVGVGEWRAVRSR